ncbi:unnamed protein product [Bursaphelenchus xylophilus]|uniref:Mitochondrial 2-oxodicarboxylate carrier n=1 Tax=Bursaphelenchus xylophilus TaxID=6326 RepID=A0A1I7RIM9_BURXY|nr:unnamed protein product [Bursaphelenchus xylophilus]CAG9118929.1 unnamed protein product [Bursaphelenchus xylophilus]
MGKLKEAFQQITAGGSAGLVEVCVMHPLDVMKTRLQLGSQFYKGLGDVFRKTLTEEGIRGFYKGIIPPIIAETPKRATKFLTFEQYKHAFQSFHGIPEWGQISLAGAAAGLTEACVNTPFELVKVRLQSDRSKTNIKTSRQVAKEVLNTRGIRGIYTALGATMYRNGTWNCIYFGLYHNVKPLLPTDPVQNLLSRMGVGFCAGTIASVANIPFDVVKSRIQAQAEGTQWKYRNTWQAIGLVYKEEGIAALYRGIVPKVMRLGPGGAIMLIVFETVNDFLKKIMD